MSGRHGCDRNTLVGGGPKNSEGNEKYQWIRQVFAAQNSTVHTIFCVVGYLWTSQRHNPLITHKNGNCVDKNIS